jgi:hypothetical protein
MVVIDYDPASLAGLLNVVNGNVLEACRKGH